MSLIEDVVQAKTDFLQAKERLLRSLANTPDDCFNLSPSPTARSTAHQVAHIAQTIKNLQALFSGKPPHRSSRSEADNAFRDWEQQFHTREEVLEMLEQNCDAYLAWLDTLTPQQLEGIIELPFDLGSGPLRSLLAFQITHMQWHIAQIDYIQTIYGNRNWNI